MNARRFIPQIRKRAIPWLLEGLLIVVSIVLGMWVTEWQRERDDREVAARVLKSVQGEIEQNLGALEPYLSVHARWVDALAAPGAADTAASGYDVFRATRPDLPGQAQTPFPFLRRSAWDAAVSGGTIRLIDHEIVAALSDIYRVQEIASGNLERLANGVLTSAAIFDPASRPQTVRLLAITLRDIQTAETHVLELYRRHLPTIRAAANYAP